MHHNKIGCRWQRWVKTSNPQNEEMFSGLPSKADRAGWHAPQTTAASLFSNDCRRPGVLGLLPVGRFSRSAAIGRAGHEQRDGAS